MPQATRGRPKTAGGYFDDGVTHLFDGVAKSRQLRDLRAQHYRAERDLIHEIERHMTEAARALHVSSMLEQLEPAGANA